MINSKLAQLWQTNHRHMIGVNKSDSIMVLDAQR